MNDYYTQVMPLKSNLRNPIITTSVLLDISVLPQNSKITVVKIRHGKPDDSTKRSLVSQNAGCRVQAS